MHKIMQKTLILGLISGIFGIINFAHWDLLDNTYIWDTCDVVGGLVGTWRVCKYEWDCSLDWQTVSCFAGPYTDKTEAYPDFKDSAIDGVKIDLLRWKLRIWQMWTTTFESRTAIRTFLINPYLQWWFDFEWSWLFKEYDREYNIDDITYLFTNFNQTVEPEKWKVNQWYILIKWEHRTKYTLLDSRYEDSFARNWLTRSTSRVSNNKPIYVWFLSYFFNITLDTDESPWYLIENDFNANPTNTCYEKEIIDPTATLAYIKITMCLDSDGYVTYMNRYEENSNLQWYFFEWEVQVIDYDPIISSLKKPKREDIEYITWVINWYQSTYNEYQLDLLDQYEENVLWVNSNPKIEFLDILEGRASETVPLELNNDSISYDIKLFLDDPDPDNWIKEVNLYVSKDWWAEQLIWTLTQPDSPWWKTYTFTYNFNRLIWNYTFRAKALDNFDGVWWTSKSLKIILLSNKAPEIYIVTPAHRQTFRIPGSSEPTEPIFILWSWSDLDWFVKTLQYYYKKEADTNRTHIWDETRNNPSESFQWKYLYLSNNEKWIFDIRVIWFDDQWTSTIWKIYKIYRWNWARYQSYDQAYSDWVTSCSADWNIWDSDTEDPRCAWNEAPAWTIWPRVRWSDCYVQPISLGSTSGTVKCWYWDWQAPEIISFDPPGGEWTNGNIQVTINLKDTWGSWLYKISYKIFHDWTQVPITLVAGEYNDTDWWTSKNLSRPSTYSYTINTIFTEEWIRYIQINVEDYVWNKSWAISPEFKIDKTTPIQDYDLENILLNGNPSDYDSENNNAYATNNWNVYIHLAPYCQNGVPCADIDKIEIRKESYSDKNNFVTQTINDIWCSYQNINSDSCKINFSRDINNVNNNAYNWDYNTSLKWREYTLNIRLVDSSWNPSSWKEYKWNVYPQKEAISDQLWEDITTKWIIWIYWNNIDSYWWSFRLRDIYWNYIVPVSDIWRTIEVKYRYKNNVYLDQYLLNATTNPRSWVITQFSNDGWQTRHFEVSSSISNYLEYGKIYRQSDWVSNWVYSWEIRSYVPTYFDDQDNQKYNWEFKIKHIEYIVSDDHDTILPATNDYSSTLFEMNPELNLRFNSIFHPRISWIPPLALEWTSKIFNLAINDKIWSNYNLSSTPVKLLVNFTADWEAQEIIQWQLRENIEGEGWKNNCLFWEKWWWTFFDSYLQCSNEMTNTPNTSQNLEEKFSLTPGRSLDSESGWYISTHIAVRYPNWEIWVWNWDIVWKTNYNYDPSSGSTPPVILAQNSLTLYWIAWWSNYSKFHQISDKERLFWGTKSRSELINEIRKNTSIITRAQEFNIIQWDTNTNIDLFNNTYKSFQYENTTIYYFKWNWADSNLILGWRIWYDKNIILITEGIDIYISDNLQSDWTAVLWIIANRAENTWNNIGGNVYLYKDVTNLEANIFADKALISYKWTPLQSDFVTQKNMGQEDLNNQLYIKWVLWTSNTLWASRSSTPICPYFIDPSDCNQHIAQEYDLEYVRRFFLTDANYNTSDAVTSGTYINYWYHNNSSKLIWGIKCELEDDTSTPPTSLDVKCYDDNIYLNNIISDSIINSYNPFDISNENLVERLASLVIEYNPNISGFPIFDF